MMTLYAGNRRGTRRRAGVALAIILLVGAVAPDAAFGQWVQWGGPDGDFKVEADGLAGSWPEDGPPRLWSRELGEGYSAILADGEQLFTLYRAEENEIVIALNAKTGKTLWEHKYLSAPHKGHVEMFGNGPRGTPLLSGDRLYTIGVAGKMHCLDRADGKVYWSHDLWGDDFKGNVLEHGYSSSPIAYNNTVIVLVGGEDASIVAFDKYDGRVVWKKQSFGNSYSTPKIINVGGEDQLVTFMATEIVGLDPDDGELEWKLPHENQWKQNVCPPIWDGKDTLFFSAPEAGSKAVRLTRNGDKTDVEELWSTRKIQFYHVTAVRDGDYVYGSSGTQSPCFLSAVNMKTGKVAWRERGFAKATTLFAGGKLIILDEDGNLAIATPSPDQLTVHSKASLLKKVAWTVPTLLGKTLFVRDKTNILALDLG